MHTLNGKTQEDLLSWQFRTLESPLLSLVRGGSNDPPYLIPEQEFPGNIFGFLWEEEGGAF